MFKRWEPAHTVIAISLALVVGVFGALGFLVWQAYHVNIAQGEERAQRGADLVARQANWVIGSSWSLLEMFAQSIEGDPERATPELVARMNGALAILPAETQLALFDADGAATYTAGAARLPDTIAREPFFRAIADGADWRISRQMQDRTDNGAIFVIAKRLERGSAFAGAALLIFRADLLQRIWEPLALGEASAASLVGEDGWVIARFPELPEPFDAGQSEAFAAAIHGADRGTIAAAPSPADGIKRIVAFTRLPEYGIISYGTVSENSLLRGLWSATYTVLLLMGPIGIALLLGSLLTARLLHQSARTQERLAAALAHNELLFREIHHRVKNNLQSVASLLQLQPIPREIKQEMAQRIAAMSAVHEHIYRSNNFTTVNLRDYLRTLIRTIRASYDPEIDVVEEIEDLAVEKDVAGPLGLIVNEVLSNAFKHAFRDRDSGKVVVTVRRGEAETGILRVDDNGPGFDPQAESKGIGRRLVTALTAQIGGSATVSGENGGHFELVFPLTTGAVSEPA